MPVYTLPTFNLGVNIWRIATTVPPVGPPDVTALGNLSPGKRSTLAAISGSDVPTGFDVFMMMYLLLPAGTDIRGGPQVDPAQDLVEVPAGSGRYYVVEYVDDVAKGFPNEHRFAVIFAANPWPEPIP